MLENNFEQDYEGTYISTCSRKGNTSNPRKKFLPTSKHYLYSYE